MGALFRSATIGKPIANDGFDIGSLSLEVPEFVKLEQDLVNKTALLTVEDANVKQQKEMWGAFLLPLVLELWTGYDHIS